MPPDTRPFTQDTDADEAWLSIGALARATGIPAETLRTWEMRYGFPVPHRKPSGHRVYTAALIPRLQRIAQALSRGHRAGETVPASEAQLDRLLRVSTAGRPETGRVDEAFDLETLADAVARFDRERLTRQLMTEATRRSVPALVREVVAPLLSEVGRRWSEGSLTISHEHFLSERVGDLLRSLRLPREARAMGPLVVLATLPGEAHELGLQMAALVVADAGCRVLYLGTEVPVDQLASLAADLDARAVAVSVSSANQSRAMRAQLVRLRRLLPSRTHLIVGGAGGPSTLARGRRMTDFADLSEWSQRAAAGSAAPGSVP